MSEIKINDLRDLCEKALKKMGVATSQANDIVDHFLENEISGKASHGVQRILQTAPAIKKHGLPHKNIEIKQDMGHIISINGHMNLGPVVGKAVLDESLKRVKEHGMSFVGANNYILNTGSMTYYLRRLADQGFIGLMSCNSEKMVTAPTGKERFLGTNPIGIAVPSDDGEHFIADFATSAIAFGKVLLAEAKDEALPKGCIIDKDGNPSTNPQDADKNGAILPLADYRGFALGLFVEMICLMFGADVIHTEHYGKDAIFIIAIDPAQLTDGYAAKVSAVLNHIRASEPAPGYDKVSIPGDRSAKTLEETIARGTVNVADKTLQKLKDLTL